MTLLPGSAAARRIADGAETRALKAGLQTYLSTSGCCAVARFRLVGPAWISTVDKDFGSARIRATNPNGRPGPQATAVLVHTHSGRWTVIAFGSAKLACGVIPPVRSDLRLPRCT